MQRCVASNTDHVCAHVMVGNSVVCQVSDKKECAMKVPPDEVMHRKVLWHRTVGWCVPQIFTFPAPSPVMRQGVSRGGAIVGDDDTMSLSSV